MEIHEYFTYWDWLTVGGYLALTTWVGHKMKGQQASIRDFFLGGRSLPWQAVSGSIIATEISGVTFIGVPGMVFAASGNFTYLQWALGSIMARILVGQFFVRYFYEQEIYSPYDFMENRIGPGVKRLATIIFSIGSILGQSVRVLVAALALKVVTSFGTDYDFAICIVIIGLFAIGWTLMGGMRTVIWTDVMQFVLFIVGGSIALIWIISSLDGGWAEYVRVGASAEVEGGVSTHGKFSLWDFCSDPAAKFTFWVAILAAPFLNLSAFGVDQLNAQRMFCCRSESDAKKAIMWSSVGQLITLLMLMVGAGLYVYYLQNPPSEAAELLFEKDHDFVFPAWIVTTLPVGLRGLILAGVFAAAISSLDSILAALSQTTLSLFHKTGAEETDEHHEKLLRASRLLVIAWGILLTIFAIFLDRMRGDINVVTLAFGMVSYTAGPLLGMFLAAINPWRHASLRGLTIGFILSFVTVLYFKADLYTILINFDLITAELAASLHGVRVSEAGGVEAWLFYAWLWPITTIVTVLCGLVFGKPLGENGK